MRHPPWSLARRLAWRLVAVMTTAVILAAVAIAWRGWVALHDLRDAGLAQQAAMVSQAIPQTSQRVDSFSPPPDLTAKFRLSDGDNLYLVEDSEGKLLATSDVFQAATLLPLLPSPLHPGVFTLGRLAGHSDGMIGFIKRSGSRWVVVLQGRDQGDALADGLLARFMAAALYLLLPIGVLAIVVTLATLRRGLRPLAEAAAAAAAVRPGDTGVLLPNNGLPREVTPLVDAVNEALTRLEQTIAAQRAFMAQAAHGLRTPLAVLTARLDSMADTAETPALRRDVDRMTRLVGQLLQMARLESLALETRGYVDLRHIAAEAVTDLAPLALREGIDLALTSPDRCPARGNHAALVLAVTNLIENAIGYAPTNSAIDVDVVYESRGSSIAVRDRGPGIPPDYHERVLRAFERGPGARAGGAGLGLAIVSEIAAAHDGDLELTNRVGGGTCFRLRFGETALPAPERLSGALAGRTAVASPQLTGLTQNASVTSSW
jgi:signal transduction histidine kinase